MARIQPALIGGLFIGVLSALPVVRNANACCCLWVIVGGALTVYVMQQGRQEPVESTEVALQGLLAGAIGAVIYMIALATLMSGAAGVNIEDQVREALNTNADIPPDVRDMVLNVFSGNRFLFVLAAVTIPMYAVFGMLGSLLGLAMFRKKTPPAAPTEGLPS